MKAPRRAVEDAQLLARGSEATLYRRFSGSVRGKIGGSGAEDGSCWAVCWYETVEDGDVADGDGLRWFGCQSMEHGVSRVEGDSFEGADEGRFILHCSLHAAWNLWFPGDSPIERENRFSNVYREPRCTTLLTYWKDQDIPDKKGYRVWTKRRLRDRPCERARGIGGEKASN